MVILRLILSLSDGILSFPKFELLPFFLVVQLSVITDLRNPMLKGRHWDEIEIILDAKIVGRDIEPLTLRRLAELNAFEFTERLQEVSAKASSEASLEAILRKVATSHVHSRKRKHCEGVGMCVNVESPS